MSLWKNYFGLGDVASSGATPTDSEASTNALPASSYTSEVQYELEKRAIFSRKWLLVTHSLRLPSTGDWLQYTVVGYRFVLVKDREGKINAFHNVCRHRAFPVVTEDSGKSRIFSCKYHGWSYGLNGKLAKAPGYQELEGFDKSQNGLLPIHVYVDFKGFVWVNLDGGPQPERAWEDDFQEVGLQPQFKGLEATDYQFDHTWEIEGDFNWKILADNYNACHHPSPDDASLANLHAGSNPEQIEQALRSATTHYFPDASLTASSQVFVIQRLVPLSSTTCVMKYEIFRSQSCSDEDFDAISKAYKRMTAEDKDVCIAAQKSLNDGTVVNGEFHPQMANTPLPFQAFVRTILEEHRLREQEAQREIWPARQKLPEEATTSKDDDDFCSSLSARKDSQDCSTMAGQSGCCGGMACQSGSNNLVY